MYTYQGTGYCIPFDEGMLDEFIEAYNEVTESDIEDIFEIDDAMSLGDWCSCDNLDSASLNDEEIGANAGVLVLRDGAGDHELLASVCQEAGIDHEEYYGNFEVACWD